MLCEIWIIRSDSHVYLGKVENSKIEKVENSKIELDASASRFFDQAIAIAFLRPAKPVTYHENRIIRKVSRFKVSDPYLDPLSFGSGETHYAITVTLS